MREYQAQPRMKDRIIADDVEGVTKEPWRDMVARASKRDYSESTLSKAGTYLANQEREVYIVTGHMTELITSTSPPQQERHCHHYRFGGMLWIRCIFCCYFVNEFRTKMKQKHCLSFMILSIFLNLIFNVF